ncbi:Mitochondrial intermediate peptidase [Rhizophlyctis rosea]|nr:Mitochondrial intermediate peptidase [Rhizophlyctis rosea]
MHHEDLKLFDTSTSSENVRTSSSTGLFGYPQLSKPSGLVDAALAALEEATRIVEAVCAARTDNEIRKTVRRLDRLSDVLCSVVDLAEFLRNVHPSREYVRAAEKAVAELTSLLSQLNTHPGLYEALKRVLDHPTIGKSLSREERAVAELLISDFEKSGVHMPESTRARFVDLNDRILGLGQAFAEVSYPHVDKVKFQNPTQTLNGLPLKLIQQVTHNGKRGGKGDGKDTADVPTGSMAAYTVLRLAQAEESRRAMYLAMNSGSPRQLLILEELLRTRGELATMLGKRSYADMTLRDKMVQSQEADVSILRNLKRTHTNDPNARIEAWDQNFYTRFISPSAPITTSLSADPLHTPQAEDSASTSLIPYFTIGGTFEGLSSLFTALYGIRFEPSTTLAGETWHDEVRKLDVVHETEGRIGTIYCDLLQRRGGERKYDTAAHFTVRCSRLITKEEMEEVAGVPGGGGKLLRNPDGEKKTERGLKQLPIVVLVTDFARPVEDGTTLLSLEEVKTLFHEMGHAMHSMLARTDFQHIAGTRVQMDFVEVPSIFTEHFATNPDFLSTFARHHKTNEPLSAAAIRSHRDAHATQTFKALELQSQIQMALLDQLYHSELATAEGFDSTKVLKDLQNRVNVIPFPEGTAWQSEVGGEVVEGIV